MSYLPGGSLLTSVGQAGDIATIVQMDELELQKSLAADAGVGVDGSALIGESLDDVIHRVTEEFPYHAPFQVRVAATQGKSIYEEWNRLKSLGLGDRGSSLYAEGGLPVDDTGEFERVVASMAYLGQTGIITGPMLLSGRQKFGDLKAIETVNRLQKLLLDAEYLMLKGNPELDALSLRGLNRTMGINQQNFATYDGSGTTITGGLDLTFNALSAACERIALYNGEVTACYLSQEQKRALSDLVDDKQRYLRENVTDAVGTGLVVHQFMSDFGDVDLIWDKALNPHPDPKNPATSSLFHASAPDVLATSPTGAAAAGGELPVDEYFYGVAPKNQYGEGPINLQATGYTTTGTNRTVTVTITHNVADTEVKSYVIYRSTTSGASYTTFRMVGEVRADYTGLTQDWDDDGSFVPGSTEALIVNERQLEISSLQPPTSWDLAKTGDTHRWFVNWYTLLKVIAPTQMVRAFNLGGSVTDPVSGAEDWAWSTLTS